VYPPNISIETQTALSKRLLRCETKFGVVCAVHLEKVNIARGVNANLGKNVYKWLFEAHHIILGDMNASWPTMSVRPHLERRDGKVPLATYGWVDEKTHMHATRASGTYLPGVAVANAPRFQGDVVAIVPPAIDMVVVHRPLTVYALPERRDRQATGPRQLGAKFVPCKLPRTLMQNLPPCGWPSDHTSVMTTIQMHGATAKMRVATWNVADPIYFGRFWPDAALGFRDETPRLCAIRKHVLELLRNTDVLALQEVPHVLVSTLTRKGVNMEFSVGYVAAPSDKDKYMYDQCVGRRRNTDDGDLRDDDVPPVPHDMLLVRETMRLGSP
jgi:hypothetical protein